MWRERCKLTWHCNNNVVKVFPAVRRTLIELREDTVSGSQSTFGCYIQATVQLSGEDRAAMLLKLIA